MNLKKVVALVLLAAVVIAGLVLLVRGNATHQDAGKLQVTASFYPLYDFARNVGGDKVQVTNITPAGSEPHDFEPSPKALIRAQESQVFIYDGGALEPWVGNFLRDYQHIAVQASHDIILKDAADEEDETKQVKDPHFWLDPVDAKQIVANIAEGLAEADPANADYYRHNAEVYTAKLDALDNEFKQGLASCTHDTVITSHAAFSYFADRYDFKVAPITGLSPEEEPGAAKLAELSDLVKREGIGYVFFESLTSPRLAQTIATETGAKTIVFDPIEGLSDADQQQGKDYLSVQRQNLANLRTALACR